MDNMIDITGIPLTEVAKAAYDLSRPQGMGFLHYQEGSLSDEDAAKLVNEDHRSCPLEMDYVRGRAVKLTVFRKDGKLLILNKWFDHSESDLEELLSRIGVKSV